MSEQKTGLQSKVDNVIRKSWLVLTLASAMCNVPAWLAYLDSSKDLRDKQDSAEDPVPLDLKENSSIGEFVDALARTTPIDEQFANDLAQEQELSVNTRVDLLTRLLTGFQVAGNYDDEDTLIGLEPNTYVGTGVHEFAHFMLSRSDNLTEKERLVWADFQEKVGFNLFRAALSSDVKNEYHDLFSFLKLLLFESERGSQPYTNLAADIPGLTEKTDHLEALITTVQTAQSEEEQARLLLEATKYYREEIHPYFNNYGWDKRNGLQESYATLVEYVAIQNFNIPPEIADLVCPPLDCSELTYDGSYSFASYEEYENTLFTVATLLAAAIAPIMMRLALALRLRIEKRRINKQEVVGQPRNADRIREVFMGKKDD